MQRRFGSILVWVTMGSTGEVYINRESGICVAVLTNDFFGISGEIAREV